MKTKILTTLTVCAFLTINSTKSNAQDIHFSQFRMTPLELDPSQAGNFGNIRAIINYRTQWSSLMVNPYKTYGGSFDMRIKNKNNKDNYFGGGLSVYSDKAGEIGLGVTSLNLSMAYHLKVNDNSYFSAGLQGGFTQCSLDLSNLRFDNQFNGSDNDPTLPSGENFQNTSLMRPNVGAGISYKYGTNDLSNVVNNNGYGGNKVNIGIAVFHILSSNYSFLENDKNNMILRYVLHARTSFGLAGSNIAIQPSGFLYYQGKAANIVAGTYIRYTLKQQSKYTSFSSGTALSLGAHVRFGDAFIPSLLIEKGPFAVGFSYDMNISGLSDGAGSMPNAFEISLRFLSPNPFGYGNTARFN